MSGLHNNMFWFTLVLLFHFSCHFSRFLLVQHVSRNGRKRDGGKRKAESKGDDKRNEGNGQDGREEMEWEDNTPTTPTSTTHSLCISDLFQVLCLRTTVLQRTSEKLVQAAVMCYFSESALQSECCWGERLTAITVERTLITIERAIVVDKKRESDCDRDRHRERDNGGNGDRESDSDRETET